MRKKLDSTPESSEAVFRFRSPNDDRFQPAPNLNRGKLRTECAQLGKESAKLIVKNESLRADVEDLRERVKVLTYIIQEMQLETRKQQYGYVYIYNFSKYFAHRCTCKDEHKHTPQTKLQ